MLNCKDAKIYFIGILGSSMLSLARISLEKGFTVGGSDRAAADMKPELEDYGVKVYSEHKAENIREFSPDFVVYSMAIGEDNPELSTARTLGLPILKRAEYAEIIIGEYPMNIAVSGSHGKSTVVAMIYSALLSAGINAGVLSGAKTSLGYSYRQGEDTIVYEACEYKNSFLNFSPDFAVITNLELDHTDFFNTLADIRNSFLLFINSVKRIAVLNADDENLISLMPKIRTSVITVGKSRTADFRYERYLYEGSYRLRVYRKNLLIADIKPQLCGEHNAFNISLAIALSYTLGLKADAYFALENFSGIERRCEKIARLSNTEVIYDYAHHPTEISATLSSLAEMGYKNIMTVFAPHTFSRTAAFMGEFAEALGRSSLCLILDIFPAREAPLEGVSATALCDRINAIGGVARYLPNSEDIRGYKLTDYDCIVLMGAGNLDGVKGEIKNSEKSLN